MTELDATTAYGLAVACAREAGTLLLGMWRGPATGVRSKSTATDLVSEADERAERAIVARIQRARPSDGLIAEEGSSVAGGSGISWYIDPLDGTINYLYGIPHWAVTICCADRRGPFVGVVYDPVRDELFSAVRGDGAQLSGRPIAVSDRADLASALIATGFGYDAAQRERQGRILAGVVGEVRDIRRAGSASLDLAWVAAGRYDGYFESVDQPWDWMAGAMCVREAGGRVTQLTPDDPARPRIIASAPDVHDALVALLAKAVQNM